MKKLLIALGILALAIPCYGRVRDLYVGTGAETPAAVQGVGTIYAAGSIETDGVLILDAANAIAVDDATPSVAGGNIFLTGINTVPTAITDLDNPYPGATYIIICGSIAGGFQSTIADAGNFTLEGAWNPVAVGDSITLYCVADNDYVEVSRGYATVGPRQADPLLTGDGLIGAPAWAFLADANLGVWRSAAGTLSIVDAGAEIANFTAANGITGTALNGTPIGTIAPAAVTGTNAVFTGTLEYGQAPDELHNNYRRTETIKFIDGFDTHYTVGYALDWNVAGVVGAGTNTIDVRDGWSELVTGAAGAGDMESTVTNGLLYTVAYAPRAESVIELTDLVTQTFHWGFYAAANEFVEIIYEAATGPNWLLRVDDTAGAETIDSGIVVTVDPTKLEIVVTAAGVVTWAIDGVPCTVVGLTNNMTANAHYFRWAEFTTAAVAHTVAVDYIEIETNKQ